MTLFVGVPFDFHSICFHNNEMIMEWNKIMKSVLKVKKKFPLKTNG